jgi:hypothetical protein
VDCYLSDRWVNWFFQTNKERKRLSNRHDGLVDCSGRYESVPLNPILAALLNAEDEGEDVRFPRGRPSNLPGDKKRTAFIDAAAKYRLIRQRSRLQTIWLTILAVTRSALGFLPVAKRHL